MVGTLMKATSAQLAMRSASVSVSEVAKGANSDFSITVDEDGVAIPDHILVQSVAITPSAATKFRVQLFAKDARTLADPRWYEFPNPYEDIDSVNDASEFWYWNRDPANRNEIFGNVSVAADGAAAASFTITILFTEGS